MYFFPLIKSLAYALMISSTYYFFGYFSNEGYGYGQIQVDGFYVLTFFFALLFGYYLFGRNYEKPSDYFVLLYGMIVLIPYSLLHDIRGEATVISILTVALPFLGVMFLCGLNLKLSTVAVVPELSIIRLISIFSILVAALLILNPPITASFSLGDSHLRRLEARELYGNRTMISYMSSIVMNGMLPLVVFWGVLRGRYSFIFVSVFVYSIFYYIYGVKAPLVYMFFAGGVGVCLRQDRGEVKFFGLIYYSIFLLFVVSWVEFYFFGYSYVEDYLIRRVFYVGSYLVGTYLQAMGSVDVSLLNGLLVPKAASMYVGEGFLGMPGLNANTNTFLYFLLQFGLPGYFLSIVLVGAVLAVLNNLRPMDEIFLFISLMFGVLVLEQSVTTTLLSSGTGILLVLFYFSRKDVRVRG